MLVAFNPGAISTAALLAKVLSFVRTSLGAESSRRCRHGVREILHIRHHSLFAPRDFDVSPHFQVVKPLLEGEFDYRDLTWEDQADGESTL